MKRELVCIPCGVRIIKQFGLKLKSAADKKASRDRWKGDAWEAKVYGNEGVRAAFGMFTAPPPANHGIAFYSGDAALSKMEAGQAPDQFHKLDNYVCDSCNAQMEHEGETNRHAFGISMWAESRNPYDHRHPWEYEDLQPSVMTELVRASLGLS